MATRKPPTPKPRAQKSTATRVSKTAKPGKAASGQDSKPSSPKKRAANSVSVEEFLSRLDHPHKAAVEQLRLAILTIDARISEEVKWNAPSFKLDDHFATFKLHPPTQLQLVLHTGTKGNAIPRQFKLDAPSTLVKWAAPDRCVFTLRSPTDAPAHGAAVVALVRQWIEQL